MNLGAKTTALFAAVVSAALVAACVLLLHYQEESLTHTIFEGVDGEAKIAAQSIANFVEAGRRESHVIASTLPIAALAPGRQADVETYLKKMVEAFPKFQSGIFIFDHQGKLLVDYPAHRELRGQSFAYREYFQRTLQENQGVVSRPYKSRRTGLPVLTFTAPMRDAKGQIAAVMACSVNLISPEALGGYRRQKFGTTGYLYVFDRSRVLVLHPEDDRMLTQVEAGKNKILEAATRGFEGTGETVNSQGIPMLLAVRQIPNLEWTVAVQITRQEAYAPVAHARLVGILVSVMAILLATVLGAVAIRYITRPLQQLENAASQITSRLADAEIKGSYDLQNSALQDLNRIRSRDEIGLLASSFLRLLTKLNSTFGSLQRSAEDWHRTFNSVNEAVVMLDLNGRIQIMNHKTEEWFGLTLQQAQGRKAEEVIFGGRGVPKEWPEISRLLEHQQITWSQGLGKPLGIFEFTVTPVANAEGITGAVLVINNITERIESEEHMRKIAKAFQIAERTLSILVKGFSEEAPLETAKIIQEETGVGAVAICDTEKVLAFVGAGSDHHLRGNPIASPLARKAIRENQVVFADGVREQYRCSLSETCPLNSVLVVPLYVDKDVIGVIQLYESRDKLFLNMNKSLGEGITRLLSNQLLLSRYEQQKRLLLMSELKLLHAQINPHFLFNALNTIIAIIRKDAGRARDLLIDLSNFFRGNLKRNGDLSTLEEELAQVNSYLEIEKARFEDRLVVLTDIDAALLKIKIPTFTLQPLIENAIKHGISRMLDQGVVKIRAYRENGFALIEIEDNAGTFTEAEQAKDGLGIKLVDKRIKNLLGNDFGTTVFCTPDEMTRVTICMPVEGCNA